MNGLASVQEDIADLRERVAVLETVPQAVADLTEAVHDLTATYNQGKGAIWVIGGVGAVLGGFIEWLLHR